MIAQGIGSVVKGVGDIRAQKRFGELYGGLAEQGEAAIPGLEKKIEQYDIGPSMRKLRQVAMEDPLGDIQRQELQRSQGTGVGALKSGGAKSLFALPSLMQGIDRSRRQIDADAFGRMKSALTTVGQAEGMVARDKFERAEKDLDSARSQALKYRLGEMGADQARRDAITGMVTSGLSTLGSLAASGAFGDGSGSAKTTKVDAMSPENVKAAAAEVRAQGGDPIEVTNMLSDFGFGQGINVPDQSAVAGLGSLPGNQGDFPLLQGGVSPLTPQTVNLSGLTPSSLNQGLQGGVTQVPQGAQFPSQQIPLQLLQTLYPGLAGLIQTGQLNMPMNRGGRTKGPFNHDTNDMEIVDKNGNSTGMSVTGDEVVLNPQQQEKIAKQSSYFRSLMKTPRFR